jgi:hypothetical protein
MSTPGEQGADDLEQKDRGMGRETLVKGLTAHGVALEGTEAHGVWLSEQEPLVTDWRRLRRKPLALNLWERREIRPESLAMESRLEKMG